MWKKRRKRTGRAGTVGEGEGVSWGGLVVYFREKKKKKER